VQRQLSAESTDDARRSIIFNGFFRFPLTLLYMLLGISVWAVYQISPEFQALVPQDHPDYLVPRYIMLYLPTGLRGILFAAILAAAMSSLDSVLNSLSAATMQDFIRPNFQKGAQNLRLSKLVTVCWGIVITGFAFFVGSISHTVIEAINMIGSVFYGPILAAFLTGILLKKVNARGIFSGIIAGVSGNLILWIFAGQINWMWWNVFGCLVTVAITYMVSILKKKSGTAPVEKYMLRRADIFKAERTWMPVYLLLIFYFILMLAFLIVISRLAV
jgi:SSS family solute:Na+ symporter